MLFAKPQALNPGSLDHTGRRLRRILRQGIEHNTHYVLSFYFVPVVWRSALKVGDALCPRQASRLHLQQGALGDQGIDAEHRGGWLSSPPCRRDQPAQTTRDAPSSIRLCRFCEFGGSVWGTAMQRHPSLTRYGMASRAATRRTECLPCMRGSCDLVECCPQQVALNHSASPVVHATCSPVCRQIISCQLMSYDPCAGREDQQPSGDDRLLLPACVGGHRWEGHTGAAGTQHRQRAQHRLLKRFMGLNVARRWAQYRLLEEEERLKKFTFRWSSEGGREASPCVIGSH